jgi:hypothetical protein
LIKSRLLDVNNLATTNYFKVLSGWYYYLDFNLDSKLRFKISGLIGLTILSLKALSQAITWGLLLQDYPRW